MFASSFQSIFSQLKLSPSLKKVLFATALGSVALALTAHQLKRRGRKRKQATQRKEGQKTVGIPDALLRTGRPSSLKRGVHILTLQIVWKDCSESRVFFFYLTHSGQPLYHSALPCVKITTKTHAVLCENYYVVLVVTESCACPSAQMCGGTWDWHDANFFKIKVNDKTMLFLMQVNVCLSWELIFTFFEHRCSVTAAHVWWHLAETLLIVTAVVKNTNRSPWCYLNSNKANWHLNPVVNVVNSSLTCYFVYHSHSGLTESHGFTLHSTTTNLEHPPGWNIIQITT